MSTNTDTRLREASRSIANRRHNLEDVHDAISPTTTTEYARWLHKGFQDPSHPSATVPEGDRWRVLVILVGLLGRGLQESDRRISMVKHAVEGRLNPLDSLLKEGW